MRYRHFIIILVVAGAFVASTPNSALGADWPRFRGPNGTGIAGDNMPVPTEWSPTKNLKWKVKLPGPGVSSPIVVGDRVFVTCYSGYGLSRNNSGDMKNLKRHLVCIDRKNGKVVWDKSVPAVLPEDPFSGLGIPAHGYASHTPVSDGKRVYVFFGKTGALAFDMKGKQLWQTSVGTGSDPNRWGSSSSPILYKNILIVPAAAESQSIYGLDAKTGSQIWKSGGYALRSVWSTPILVQVDDKRTDLVMGAAGETWGLIPETGKLRWYNESIAATKTSVVANDGIVFTVEGGRSFGGGGVTSKTGAVRAGGEKDTTEKNTLWTKTTNNSYATPVIHEGRLYFVTNGLMTCFDAKTGKEIYKERLQDANGGRQGGGFGGGGFGGGLGGGDYSSPVLANGHLYYVKANGSTFVVKTGDDFKQIAVNHVTNADETFQATPAISNGQLFLRSDKHLYCVSGS